MVASRLVVVGWLVVSAAQAAPVSPAGQAWVNAMLGWRQMLAGGYQSEWRTSGPLPCRGFDDRQLDPRAALDPAARRPDGTPLWSPGPARDDAQVVTLPGRAPAATWLTCTITLPLKVRCRVILAGDDGRELWLNGEKVHARPGCGGPREKPEPVELEWQRGANALLLRVFDQGGEHGFRFAVDRANLAEGLWREMHNGPHRFYVSALAADGGAIGWLVGRTTPAYERDVVLRALAATDQLGEPLRQEAGRLTPGDAAGGLALYAAACELRRAAGGYLDARLALGKLDAGAAAPVQAALDKLLAGGVPAGDPRFDDLRRAAVAAWLARFGVRELVYAVRQPGKDGHWYANFSYWSSDPAKTMYSDRGRLAKVELASGQVTTLLDAPRGSVRDPQLHYDGRRIVFSYRKDGQPFYHLYEIGADGQGLRQITGGPYDDLEPTWLPDGGIAFVSSRCNRWVNCWHTRVAVVYRCDADGGNVRQLSSNIEQDNTPWVLPDGRILHQRWEYIDRSQLGYHHLWTMNPDGTGQMVYFGNMHHGTVMIDAKPIPGTEKIVASFSPGHGQSEHAGTVTIVDPRNGPDDRAAARAVSRESNWLDPYPLAEDCFLAARGTEIRVMDGTGRHALVHRLGPDEQAGGVMVQEPRPIAGRPRERVIPPFVDPGQETGRVYVQDVYRGRNMAGVKRGEIKKLLVLEALPKPVNFSGGMEPLTLGGSFTLERILGTVPVEPDGSAFFELPALRSLFFVALDDRDLSVKRMQSFLTVQPGESLSCVGCHESRRTAPPARGLTMAMNRRPNRLEPIPGVPDVLDFPRDIQPILDRHCVPCHDSERTARGGPRSGGVVLCGDRGPMYSHSYTWLTFTRQFADGRNAQGNRAPRTIGSAASPLLAKLGGAHHGVKASAAELRTVRLWIDTGAPYPGTYAALGSGMVGSPTGEPAVGEVLGRRCGSCHAREWFHEQRREIVCNLSRPDHSLLLRKPLALAGGGYGMGRAGDPVTVFANRDDPDYQLLLAALRRAQQRLAEIKRFDMPGFQPNPHYLREMQLYGILPAKLDPATPVDPYRTDQAYWRSQWVTAR